jgi:hypothetical protein
VSTAARSNLVLALMALLLFVIMHLTTGRIPTDNGQGYDGADYGRMLTATLHDGTPITELRPLVILLNRPMYRWLHSARTTPRERVEHRSDDVVRTFVVMNGVYAFVLACGLLWLMSAYGASLTIRAYAVGTVFTTIAVARMLAYYPVLVDLGAYACITLALVCIVTGRRRAAAVACTAAALSREFGVVAAVFGLHRDLRTGVSRSTSLATYLPAFVAWVGIRLVVQHVWNAPERLQQGEFLLNNAALWRDPAFAGFFFYFLVTVFGGVSAIVIANGRRLWGFLRREPEWITFALPIAVAAALGGPETWRYLGCLVPAAAVMFAAVAVEWSAVQRYVVLSAGLIVTVLSQQPFAPMTIERYFIEWFPYYVHIGQTPVGQPLALQPWWGWRLAGAALAMWVLSLAAQPPGRPAAHARTETAGA